MLASFINNAQFVLHFIGDVKIFFDQTAYSITENQQVVTAILRLSDTYREDIVVDVAISELQGTQDDSHGVLKGRGYMSRCCCS